MIGKYSAVNSMPMNLNPFSNAALPVEPEPVNGSRTVPFGGVTSLTKYSISDVGFTVGWKLRCGCTPFSSNVPIPVDVRVSGRLISRSSSPSLRSFLFALAT